MKPVLREDLEGLSPSAKKANVVHALHQITEAVNSIEHYLVYDPPPSEVVALLERVLQRVIRTRDA